MTLRPNLPLSPHQSERFERLRPIVEGMARNMRPADEDMLQAGLVKVWELITREKDDDDRYLIASARNAMIDRIRYQKIRLVEKQILHACELEALTCTAENGENLPIDVKDALAILPARMRRAFVLHYLRDYTIAETAIEMQIPEKTVKRLCAKAKQLLRVELQ